MKREHRREDALVDRVPVEPNRLTDLRVHGLLELAAKDLAEQQMADDLDRPAGRAGRAADEHQPDQQ